MEESMAQMEFEEFKDKQKDEESKNRHKSLDKVFEDKHKFQDDIWGQIVLNDIECDVIDTPEFQRLFRTSQLGFVDLVYQTANHTRGAHSIGACEVTKKLMNYLVINTAHLRKENIKISKAEKVLIRLGALLHDISHVPLSHDIEKKTHKIFYKRNSNNDDEQLKIKSYYGHYNKHDDYEVNPLLYILLCDEDKSILARVLRHHSASFYELLKSEKDNDGCEHIKGFIEELLNIDKIVKIKEEWNPESKLLPNLLFHLFTYEDPSEYENWNRKIAIGFDNNNGKPIQDNWSLGPPSYKKKLHNLWYQPFRHDIIGNTLCADLIDYLK